MRLSTTLSAVVCLGAICCPSSLAAERPDLSGKWQLEGSKEVVWSIEQQGDNIHIAQIAPTGAAKTEIDCNTFGKECQSTFEGDRAKVTYYYNGPALVEMRIEGDRVTKTLRKLTEDGGKMTVEIQHIVPSKTAEKLTYIRQQDQPKTSSLQ
jgi:hypothetical protein